MTTLTASKQELLEAFQYVGIARGDVVYVASSLAALGLMDEPIEGTLWALRGAVGKGGTLVMPAFDFGFCRGDPFDPQRTPSACGQLSEAFRSIAGAVRSTSPPFSTVTAVGPRAAEIVGIESLTSFGRDSIFQYLRDIEAKHLLIGCGFNEGVAHVHWLEELAEVPYRYWKKIEGEVIVGGEARHRAFFMYARRRDVDVRVDADPLGAAFEEAGHVRVTTVGLCRIRAFDLNAFAAFAEPLFKEDPLVVLDPACRKPFLRGRTPVTGIDHIGIVSPYADRIREFLRSLNCDLSHEGLVDELGVRCEYFSGLEVKLEFVNPVAKGSCVDGHLRHNSTAPLHHIALTVSNMSEAIEFFKAKGYGLLDGRFHLGPKPGQRVTFLSPVATGGLLVELVCNDAKEYEVLGGETPW